MIMKIETLQIISFYFYFLQIGVTKWTDRDTLCTIAYTVNGKHFHTFR